MTVGNLATLIVALVALAVSLFGTLHVKGNVSVGEPSPTPKAVVTIKPSVVTPVVTDVPTASPSAVKSSLKTIIVPVKTITVTTKPAK